MNTFFSPLRPPTTRKTFRTTATEPVNKLSNLQNCSVAPPLIRENRFGIKPKKCLVRNLSLIRSCSEKAPTRSVGASKLLPVDPAHQWMHPFPYAPPHRPNSRHRSVEFGLEIWINPNRFHLPWFQLNRGEIKGAKCVQKLHER